MEKMLTTRPDTKEYVWKLYNLDKPSVTEAVRRLREWIQKQPHFNKKHFGDMYLETAIIISKGSIERAKLLTDKICTMRTLMPHFFGKFNCKTDFEHMSDVLHSFLLPKLTEDHYRVKLTKFFDVDWESSQAIYFFRYEVILTEYAKNNDYTSGLKVILDFTDANVMSYLKRANPVLIRQAMAVFVDGYGVRIKAIHILSESKFIDGVVSLLKQVVSAKIASRIHVHKRAEDLYAFIPKEVLPKDYGGEERSIKTLQEQWLNVLSSEEHLKHLEEMNKATTNEALRPKDQFCEQYSGLPGTFRYLSVD